MANVALVVLDTLRKDAFDEHFDWLPGTRFENAWSTSHWTVPAHASLFTGRYGSEVGSYAGAESLDIDEPVLAERLRRGGYKTRAFSGNVNISSQFDFHRGFDQFEGSWRLKAISENIFNWDKFIAETRNRGPERYPLALWKCVIQDCATIPSLKRGALMKLRDMGWGRKTVDDGAQRALDMIQETRFDDDEFLFLNLMEAHTPYKPPEEYQTVEPPELRGLEMTFTGIETEPSHVKQAYEDEVRYLSDVYRKIFEELKPSFDVVITLSDHGEMLGEHGAWEHMVGLYPELTHVPLILWTGEDGVDHNDAGVSILDVHATVCSIAGIDRGDSRGRDLRGELGDDDWLTEYHGISERHRESLLEKGITDIDHLFEPLNGFSQGGFYYFETFDGSEMYGEAPYDDLERRLADLVDGLDKRAVSENEPLDDSVMSQLKDLGYA